MKLIAFAASNSQQSINKKFVTYAAQRIAGKHAEILDLNDFEVPIFSVDREKHEGFPQKILSFIEKLENSDFIVISLAEYNGSYTPAFKNIFDWSSRVKLKMFEGKKLLLLSTSPGGGGGKFVMQAALNRFPRHGATDIQHFSLPSFKENFDENQGITNPELRQQLEETFAAFLKV